MTIQHNVLFQLKSEDATERAAQAATMKMKLESLAGVIPGLLSIKAYFDIGQAEGNWHVSLISLHESPEALQGYQVHPAHVEVATWIRSVISARGVVDFATE